ncbi:carbamoyl phosphate synthase small subunit [Lactovum miscens]|uniref:Carbamoyl phosphate synthase small chain n=1 Tax=Lactovum miscens TaxID=190387 RepID=A0A841C7F7_9LACT|nr:carbamoyl phosphate synthase small subunit [Lactovum miscens]MBB5887522.1 carbamoyl-phosphate synthase small subunit [Lactovum miscens]
MKRYLILEDGSIFEGNSFGATTDATGELVFSTGMTGYQESITDQSYNGQLLIFTYPLIGNYGINRDDNESLMPTTKAVIVKEVARRPSNWRNEMSLDDFLKSKNIPAISGIDTRALTRKIRKEGTMRASLISEIDDLDEEIEGLKTLDLPTNQVEQVSTLKAYPSPGKGRKVIVVDFGLKHSILRELSNRNCDLIVLPYNIEAKTILDFHPDGVVLSNGPGDPKDVPEAIEMIRNIQGKVPIFGICLGHQLFSLANGADTYKMKFGHRGFNHAVRDLSSGKIQFTSQNHGFAVNQATCDPERLIVTHVEINDGSVEGVRHAKFAAFSVQFHPDSAPGPHDAVGLFDNFMTLMDDFKKGK